MYKVPVFISMSIGNDIRENLFEYEVRLKNCFFPQFMYMTKAFCHGMELIKFGEIIIKGKR